MRKSSGSFVCRLAEMSTTMIQSMAEEIWEQIIKKKTNKIGSFFNLAPSLHSLSIKYIKNYHEKQYQSEVLGIYSAIL